MEEINWGTVLVDIVIIIVASQTTWCLLWLLVGTNGYVLNKPQREEVN